MTIKITYDNKKETLIVAQSWLDILSILNNNVVKIEKI